MEAKSKKNWGTLGLIGLFLLTKLKYVLVALKFAKFSTIITMFISLGVYASIFGWRFAVAIVYCMAIHEMGHLIAMKIKKIPASPVVFIPFVGAAISIKGEIKDADTEAYIAYGGPLAGLLSIIPALPLYLWTGDSIFALIIYLGAFLNLFNLLPVSPLDGGRIAAALSTHIWGLGLLILLGLNFYQPSPILILVLIIGAITWFSRLGEGKKLNRNNEIMDMRSESLLKISTFEEAVVPEMARHLEQDVPFEVLERMTVRLEQMKVERTQLADIQKPTFVEKITNPHQYEKELEHRNIRLELWQLERDLSFAFSDSLTQYPEPEHREYRKNDFISHANELIRKARISQKEEMKEIEKENEKLKTYYQTSKATKLKWASLYIGMIAVLSAVLIRSTLLVEEISKALQ